MNQDQVEMAKEQLAQAALAYFERVWCPAKEPASSDIYRHSLFLAACRYGTYASIQKVEPLENRNLYEKRDADVGKGMFS